MDIRRLHREDGEAGHLGEFFVALGLFIVAGGVVVLSVFSSSTDAATTGWLYVVAGIGIAVFGAYGIVSGWGRHHPRFEHGGDPDIPDEYVAEPTR